MDGENNGKPWNTPINPWMILEAKKPYFLEKYPYSTKVGGPESYPPYRKTQPTFPVLKIHDLPDGNNIFFRCVKRTVHFFNDCDTFRYLCFISMFFVRSAGWDFLRRTIRFNIKT